MPKDRPAAVLFTVRGLSTSAGQRILHRGFDLDIASGEIVAVRGPSGCGKTTLLRTLAWLQDPAAGEVRLRGDTPERIGWPAWRRLVALTAQIPAIFPGSVGENLARPFAYRGNGGAAWPRDRARRLLDQVRLDDVPLDAVADQLSVGQQQRLAVVRSLLLEPSVLLLDEPTSALDADAAAAMADLIRSEIEARGAAALVVTHAAQASRDGAAWFDRSLELPQPEARA